MALKLNCRVSRIWVASALTLCVASIPALAQEAPVQVTVDGSRRLAVMQPEAMGIAVAVWDKFGLDPAAAAHIVADGFGVIRYPGGSYADIYHWKTNTATAGMRATIQPGLDFDHFAAFARRCGASPLITLNYGTNAAGTGGGDPSEAAAWVRYANVTRKYGIKYWEVGNEVYGNGFYNGHGWEADLHAPASATRLKNPLLGPDEYGRNVAAYSDAMKAVDPGIKVGAVLTTPGNWPDGQRPRWNKHVLEQCGAKIDFVVVHWYPNGRTTDSLEHAPDAIPAMVAQLKQEISRYCGANAGRIGIWMTEGDASGWNTRPPGAWYAADEFAAWLSSGAAHVDWWDLHNGAHATRDGYYDDQGILSNGSRAATFTEPRPNTPFPPWYGLQLFHDFAQPGDTFVSAASSSDNVVAFAVSHADGSIGVVLLNRTGAPGARVTVSGAGTVGRSHIVLKAYNPLHPAQISTRAITGWPAAFSVPPGGILVIRAHAGSVRRGDRAH
ncbi:MAG: hypothetical protein KGJ62_01370 [Armatimonadetes bacterium]|nr:hypothetical protein [Armatimonadota bacterium]MDE2205845.1 hypothetical protein [Armatimonadota bacterium]